MRQVRVGERFDERVEILSGLDAGERVALDPLARNARQLNPVTVAARSSP